MNPIANPITGGLIFVAIKFFGYSFAARLISQHYSAVGLNRFKVGGARTLIGVIFGTIYFYLASVVFPGVLVLLGLIPIRIVEWTLLICWFYDRELKDWTRLRDVIVLGTIWSFMLDLPALLGFCAVAAFWVC